MRYFLFILIILSNNARSETFLINFDYIFNNLEEYHTINNKINKFVKDKNKKIKNIDIQILNTKNKEKLIYLKNVKKKRILQYQQETFVFEKRIKKPFTRKILKHLKSFSVKKNYQTIIDHDSLIYTGKLSVKDITSEFLIYIKNKGFQLHSN